MQEKARINPMKSHHIRYYLSWQKRCEAKSIHRQAFEGRRKPSERQRVPTGLCSSQISTTHQDVDGRFVQARTSRCFHIGMGYDSNLDKVCVPWKFVKHQRRIAIWFQRLLLLTTLSTIHDLSLTQLNSHDLQVCYGVSFCYLTI